MDAIATPPPRRHAPSLPALAVTALVHAALLALLLARPEPQPSPNTRSAAPERTEVVFLPPRSLLGPPAPPPALQVPPRATRAAQAQPQPQATPLTRSNETTSTASVEPDPSRALDLRLPEHLRDAGPLPPRDPMRTPPVRLAGREEAYVEGIVMRRQLSPADIVAGIGAMFFGGGRDPCIDIRSLLASASSDEERRDLIHRERRHRCR